MADSTTNRKWKNEETMLLIEFMEENSSFLMEGVNNGKTRQMMNTKWKEAAKNINAFGLMLLMLTETS